MPFDGSRLPEIGRADVLRRAAAAAVRWNKETAQSGPEVAKALRDTADRLEAEVLSRAREAADRLG